MGSWPVGGWVGGCVNEHDFDNFGSKLCTIFENLLWSWFLKIMDPTHFAMLSLFFFFEILTNFLPILERYS